jgi:folate-binding protein YgfZ
MIQSDDTTESQSGAVRLSHKKNYEIFRYANGIAEGQEMAGRIPLECNLDLLNYICFRKGCYVGQELTARTKYKVIYLLLLYYVPSMYYSSVIM